MRRLAIWAGVADVPGDETPLPGAPTRGEALYQPAPGTERANCSNCRLWVQPSRLCTIHDPGLPIPGHGICRHHLWGAPGAAPSSVNAPPVNPRLSGLQLAPGGASCDRCAFYTPGGATQGQCGGVLEEDGTPRLTVEALARCSRWTR